MKVTFLANELIDLEIIIKPIDFEKIPLVGDFITIVDFLKDEDKEFFKTHLKSLNKVNLALVDGRIWNSTNGENYIQLSLYFEELGK